MTAPDPVSRPSRADTTEGHTEPPGCASCDAWNSTLAGILADLKAALAEKGECDEVNVLRAQWCEAFGLEIKHVIEHLPKPEEKAHA